MLEQWGLELLKGIGRLFLNPLLYWFILLSIVISYKRIHRDRRNFGKKIIGKGDEVSYTLWPSLLGGGLISLVLVGVGVVFNFSTLLLLSIIIIVLSLSFKETLLSPGYTIGITYFILLFSPFLLASQTIVDSPLPSHVNFTGLAGVLGLLFIVEGLLIKQTKKTRSYPDLALSNRGAWIGTHHIAKLAIIPLVMPIPVGALESFAQFWPYIPMGSDTFGLVVFPFVIGFNHTVLGMNPHKAADKIAQSTVLLGFIVFLMAVSSVYVGWLATLAIGVGILGKEYLNYHHRLKDSQKTPYFPGNDQTLTVLDIIPGSPADRLDINPGDSVRKVNGKKVASIQSFYEALQGSGAFFKLDLVDKRSEIRFVQSAFYEGEHYELGIIFVKAPFRKDPA